MRFIALALAATLALALTRPQQTTPALDTASTAFSTAIKDVVLISNDYRDYAAPLQDLNTNDDILSKIDEHVLLLETTIEAARHLESLLHVLTSMKCSDDRVIVDSRIRASIGSIDKRIRLMKILAPLFQAMIIKPGAVALNKLSEQQEAALLRLNGALDQIEACFPNAVPGRTQ